jgi:hypothetical protein
VTPTLEDMLNCERWNSPEDLLALLQQIFNAGFDAGAESHIGYIGAANWTRAEIAELLRELAARRYETAKAARTSLELW